MTEAAESDTYPPAPTAPATKKPGVSPEVKRLGTVTVGRSGYAPYALTLLQDKHNPNLWHAVELSEVTFKQARHLEPAWDGERRGGAMGRIEEALLTRTMIGDCDWASEYSKRGGR